VHLLTKSVKKRKWNEKRVWPEMFERTRWELKGGQFLRCSQEKVKICLGGFFQPIEKTKPEKKGRGKTFGRVTIVKRGVKKSGLEEGGQAKHSSKETGLGRQKTWQTWKGFWGGGVLKPF